jgi:hypothetical protein
MLVLALMAVGCGKESAPGGPGATAKPNGTTTNGTAGIDSKNTFTIKVPATDVNIDQGEGEDVTLTVDRGDQFKQKVALAFEAPPGVTVTPKSADVMPDQKDIKVRISADAAAALGKGPITVTATPEAGKAVSQKFQIDVKKGDGTNTEKPAPPPKPLSKY